MKSNCPVCEGPIHGFVATGLDKVQIDPCGHRVGEHQLDDVVRHDRRAEVQDAGDGDLYIADGGRSGVRVVCRTCGFERLWHPSPDQGRHKHDLATDHDVAYEGAFDCLVTDGGQVPRDNLVDEDDDVLAAVAERGRKYVIFELLGRRDDDFLSVQDLRTNDDVDDVDDDSPLEAVVEDLVRRVDNMAPNAERAWSIAGDRVDAERVDAALERWGADDA